MAHLSEKEIEDLKKTHPQKRILRFIFLVCGSFIILLGLALLFTSFDFGIKIEDINISFIIDLLLIVVGMIIASKYFIAPYYLRENSLKFANLRSLREPVEKTVEFYSLTISRLIAAILMILAGGISFLIFGLDVGHEIKYGSAVVLGGPSFFYVTGLPALGIGFGLLLYFLLSLFKGRFSKSKNFLFFYEIRPGFPWLTEVPKKDIEAIRYQNNHLGPKLGWIMLLLPFITLQLMTAIPLFAIEKAGPEYVLSWTFMIISILEIISLILLIIFPQNYFEIATKERFYEMWFSPIKIKRQKYFKDEFSDFLDCNIIISPKKSEIDQSSSSESIFSDLDTRQFQLFRLIFGTFLIVGAIVMLTQMVLFGPWVWWISLIYGFILLIKAFCYDFSNKNGDLFQVDEQNNIFRFKRLFKFKFHYITAFKVKEVKIRKWFRKLDFFDIVGLGGLLIFLTLQQAEGWFLADTPQLISDNIFGTFYMIIVFLFVFFYLCLPIDVIEFITATVTYRINITTKIKKKNLFFKYLYNLKNFPKEIITKDTKRTFSIRIGLIGALIIGTSFYFIIFIIFIF